MKVSFRCSQDRKGGTGGEKELCRGKGGEELEGHGRERRQQDAMKIGGGEQENRRLWSRKDSRTRG